MSLDSVQPSITSQAVHPGQDAHKDAHGDRRREQRQQGTEEQQSSDPQPVVNDLGQLLGGTINITA